jgi:hypothetical protein
VRTGSFGWSARSPQGGLTAAQKSHSDNITGLGENLDCFGRRVFRSAVAYGISWVFVDNPVIAQEIEEARPQIAVIAATW